MDAPSQSAKSVQPGCRAILEYELSTDHELLESTQKTGPLELKIGGGRLHPAIEKQLWGLHEGDPFEFFLEASLGFGDLDPQLKITLRRAQLPEHLREVGVGFEFDTQGPDKRMRRFRVISSDPEQVVLDGNHPMAGESLCFRGRVLSIFPE